MAITVPLFELFVTVIDVCPVRVVAGTVMQRVCPLEVPHVVAASATPGSTKMEVRRAAKIRIGANGRAVAGRITLLRRFEQPRSPVRPRPRSHREFATRC